MKLINKFVFYKKGEGGLMDFIEELKLQKRKENIKILRKEINEKWGKCYNRCVGKDM